ILVFMVPALFRAKVPEDITADNFRLIAINIAIEFLCMVLLAVFVRKRKHLYALISVIVALLFPTNQILMFTTILLILLFFLRSTREYFKGNGQPAAKSNETEGEGAEVIDVKGETVEEGSESAEEAPSRPAAAPKTRAKTDLDVSIRQAAPEDADTIHALMLMSFEEYRASIPPSSALEETSESILEALQSGSESAAILYEDDVAVAMVRYKFEGDAIAFFRLSVIPSKRRRGYAKRLVKWIEHQGTAKGMNASRCKVRQTVQNNVRMYQDMGYEILDTELVVRPTGTVKALSMEKSLRPQ
ncbi:MAG: GNAT family N-acetyltransferase, partial [Cohnella sp.]|nr:GNAT family N-acetyltransferase [Cohnella sp.]